MLEASINIYIVTLSIALQKFDWDDEFLSEIKRMDLESPQFHEIWERLFGALVGSFDLYSPYCKTFFDKALKAFPNNVIVTIKHAEVLLSFQRNNEAENWLNKAIEIDANRCRPWVLLWRLNPSSKFKRSTTRSTFKLISLQKHHT